MVCRLIVFIALIGVTAQSLGPRHRCDNVSCSPHTEQALKDIVVPLKTAVRSSEDDEEDDEDDADDDDSDAVAGWLMVAKSFWSSKQHRHLL